MTFIMLSFGALQLYIGLNPLHSNNKLVQQSAIEINNQEVNDEPSILKNIPESIETPGSDTLEDAYEE